MKILYIFPHPDDESFGPAGAIAKQIRENHKVYLLTLTRGGATKQRHKFGYSVEEMGNIRYQEMTCVKEVLGLTDLTVLDLPDSGLKEMNQRDIEFVIRQHIQKVKPDIIVTYPVHGISGFHDHIVTHSAVKNVFCDIQDIEDSPRRLAFFTINKTDAEKQEHFRLNYSEDNEIDCITEISEEDIRKALEALDCYKTYSETIDKSGIRNIINSKVSFEIFQEKFNPKLKDLTEKLN
ncbi:MAG: PIG-L family deacetylase [Ignavibacteria bacterium]|nr:PIG-L family deacetylase [Ignavibacteria bacterium]